MPFTFNLLILYFTCPLPYWSLNLPHSVVYSVPPVCATVDITEHLSSSWLLQNGKNERKQQQDSLFLSPHCQIDRLEISKIFILLGNGFQLKGIWPGVRLYFSQPTQWYLERPVSRSLAEKMWVKVQVPGSWESWRRANRLEYQS